MDPAEGPHIGSPCCARALTGVTVHFTSAIAMILPRPLRPAMADHRLGGMTPAVTLPLLRLEPWTPRRLVLRAQGRAGRSVGMVADPPALCPRLAPDHPDEGGDDRGRQSRGLSADWPAAGAGQREPDGACFFSPACGSNAAASKAVPGITPVGAVAFRLACIRCRSGCRCLRERPNSRARRAVGSPLANPRRHRTQVAGRCRVFAKTVPVSRVSSPWQARQREAGTCPWARNRRRSACPQCGQIRPSGWRCRSSQRVQRLSSNNSSIGKAIIGRGYHN